MRLEELAALLGGKLRGDGGLEVTGVAGLSDASGKDVSFVSSGKALKDAKGSGACCLIVPEFYDDMAAAQIMVEDPEMAFFSVALPHFRPGLQWPRGISDKAYVDPSAGLSPDVSVMPFSYISADAIIGRGTLICPGVFVGEGARTGEECVLYPGSALMDGVLLGDRVIVHAGSVIGADGYGYMQRQGKHIKKPQTGGVIVEDDVEIGANCAIDRATMGNTVIGRGSKLDNLVHVAHNVTLGEGTLMTAQTGIAGSTRAGKYLIMGGQSGIKDHVVIADNTILAAKSAALGDIKKGGVYAGIPAIESSIWLRATAAFSRLPEMQKRLRALEKRLEEIEKKGSDEK